MGGRKDFIRENTSATRPHNPSQKKMEVGRQSRMGRRVRGWGGGWGWVRKHDLSWLWVRSECRDRGKLRRPSPLPFCSCWYFSTSPCSFFWISSAMAATSRRERGAGSHTLEGPQAPGKAWLAEMSALWSGGLSGHSSFSRSYPHGPGRRRWQLKRDPKPKPCLTRSPFSNYKPGSKQRMLGMLPSDACREL